MERRNPARVHVPGGVVTSWDCAKWRPWLRGAADTRERIGHGRQSHPLRSPETATRDKMCTQPAFTGVLATSDMPQQPLRASYTEGPATKGDAAAVRFSPLTPDHRVPAASARLRACAYAHTLTLTRLRCRFAEEVGEEKCVWMMSILRLLPSRCVGRWLGSEEHVRSVSCDRRIFDGAPFVPSDGLIGRTPSPDSVGDRPFAEWKVETGRIGGMSQNQPAGPNGTRGAPGPRDQKPGRHLLICGGGGCGGGGGGSRDGSITDDAPEDVGGGSGVSGVSGGPRGSPEDSPLGTFLPLIAMDCVLLHIDDDDDDHRSEDSDVWQPDQGPDAVTERRAPSAELSSAAGERSDRAGCCLNGGGEEEQAEEEEMAVEELGEARETTWEAEESQPPVAGSSGSGGTSKRRMDGGSLPVVGSAEKLVEPAGDGASGPGRPATATAVSSQEPQSPPATVSVRGSSCRSVVELARVELARVELARVELARVELAQVELARVELARVELARVDLARVELARAKLAPAERGMGFPESPLTPGVTAGRVRGQSLLICESLPVEELLPAATHNAKVEGAERSFSRQDSMVLLMKKLDQLDLDIEEALSAPCTPSGTPVLKRRKMPVAVEQGQNILRVKQKPPPSARRAVLPGKMDKDKAGGATVDSEDSSRAVHPVCGERGRDKKPVGALRLWRRRRRKRVGRNITAASWQRASRRSASRRSILERKVKLGEIFPSRAMAEPLRASSEASDRLEPELSHDDEHE
ncbi:unnamed protein product [Lampetra fluviatilis]